MADENWIIIKLSQFDVPPKNITVEMCECAFALYGTWCILVLHVTWNSLDCCCSSSQNVFVLKCINDDKNAILNMVCASSKQTCRARVERSTNHIALWLSSNFHRDCPNIYRHGWKTRLVLQRAHTHTVSAFWVCSMYCIITKCILVHVEKLWHQHISALWEQRSQSASTIHLRYMCVCAHR